jgi:hypothetical protein
MLRTVEASLESGGSAVVHYRETLDRPKMKHGRRFTTVFHRKRKSVHHHSMSLSCQERTIRFASAVPWLERQQREELPILWLGPQRPEATKTPSAHWPTDSLV